MYGIARLEGRSNIVTIEMVPYIEMKGKLLDGFRLVNWAVVFRRDVNIRGIRKNRRRAIACFQDDSKLATLWMNTIHRVFGEIEECRVVVRGKTACIVFPKKLTFKSVRLVSESRAMKEIHENINRSQIDKKRKLKAKLRK